MIARGLATWWRRRPKQACARWCSSRPSVSVSGGDRQGAAWWARQLLSRALVAGGLLSVGAPATKRLPFPPATDDPLFPLNLFFGVLLFKKQGELALQRSGLDYTIIRPGERRRVLCVSPPTRLSHARRLCCMHPSPNTHKHTRACTLHSPCRRPAERAQGGARRGRRGDGRPRRVWPAPAPPARQHPAQQGECGG